MPETSKPNKPLHEVVIGQDHHGAYIVFALTTDHGGTRLGVAINCPQCGNNKRHVHFLNRPIGKAVMKGAIAQLEATGMVVKWRGLPYG